MVLSVPCSAWIFKGGYFNDICHAGNSLLSVILSCGAILKLDHLGAEQLPKFIGEFSVCKVEDQQAVAVIGELDTVADENDYKAIFRAKKLAVKYSNN